MAKTDIKNAYRIIPIHPDDRYLLGIKWRDQYFIDLALISAKFKFHLPGKTNAHLPGKTNLIADALSRLNFQEFFRLVPDAHPTPVNIPEGLQARLTCKL